MAGLGGSRGLDNEKGYGQRERSGGGQEKNGLVGMYANIIHQGTEGKGIGQDLHTPMDISSLAAMLGEVI